ncbi:MAG: DUF6164 family protein [Pseudohongiellaceae bacterium]|nr:MAG: hypothetical protein A3H44_09100 [Gammaproteobacteria bacterium RIFCSPLOWO2_02_FULL_57_10]
MSRLLFRLRHVPDDEAEEVRQLLTAHNIEFYETSAGNWGISMPALWIHEDDRFEEARALLEVYQQERAQRIREEYDERVRQGEAESLLTSFTSNPLRFIFYSGLIVAVLYLSISSFFSF